MLHEISFQISNMYSTKAFSETDIMIMLEVLIDDMLAMLGGRVCQQTDGMPMDTKLCSFSPRFVPLFV
jgi:hypothetical protein